jgi:hypothetical protein
LKKENKVWKFKIFVPTFVAMQQEKNIHTIFQSILERDIAQESTFNCCIVIALLGFFYLFNTS